MTATHTSPRTTPTTGRQIWKTGLVAGATAAVATSAYAAVVHAAGVSFEIKGEAIPVLGFAQMTFLAAILGTVFAVVLNRKAHHAARTFVRTTVVLTALTFVPDVLADASASTRIALVVSHVLAAAIIIPALASRLHD
ncbi:MAG TPA: DUF6069 family protein [Acidimicrobiia bacterium]|nr:DUF6069 family protein [Acidimicrobiia bacterium]